MANNWSGQPNGRIPLAMMTELRDDLGAGGYAQTDAARAYQAIAAEFEEAVGVPLKFVEAYRDFAMQTTLRNAYLSGTGNVAAVPGTSNHGWGLAFDFAYPLTSWNTDGQAWFRANEARFGFSSAQGLADGEPWHKVYTGPTPTLAGLNASQIITPTPEQEGDTMRTLKSKQTGAVYNIGELTYQQLDTLAQGSQSAHVWNGTSGAGEPVVVDQAVIDVEIGQVQKRRAQFAAAFRLLTS